MTLEWLWNISDWQFCRHLFIQFPSATQIPKPPKTTTLWADNESTPHSTTLCFLLEDFSPWTPTWAGFRGDTMTSEIVGRSELPECTTPKKNKTTNQLLSSETFQYFFKRSLKMLLKSSKYLGFGTTTPPHHFQQTLLNVRIFLFFCPEKSFFPPSSCFGDREWEKNVLLSRKKFPLYRKPFFLPNLNPETQSVQSDVLLTSIAAQEERGQRERHKHKDIELQFIYVFLFVLGFWGVYCFVCF